MLKLLVLLLVISIYISPASAEFNTVTCNINEVIVETKDKEDCKKIGGEALKNYMFVIYR